MIKPQELRIGNLIETPLGISSVTGIDIDGMLHAKPKDDARNFSYKLQSGWEGKIKPIAVTEEWLLRLGFVKTLAWKSDTAAAYNFVIGNFGCYFPYPPNEGVSAYVGGDAMVFKTGIQHVHQLQNLYYALSGTELVLTTEK